MTSGMLPQKKLMYFGFTGMIEPGGVSRIASAFNQAVNQGVDEAHLAISSLGGLVADGIFLYNHLRGLPIRKVFYNTGTVASIAAAIFVAADERYCSTHGMFMIHPTALNFPESMNAERLESFLAASLADDGRTESILRERTRIPENTLGDRRRRDVHISAADARDYGIVQEIREFSLPRGQQIFQI